MIRQGNVLTTCAALALVLATADTCSAQVYGSPRYGYVPSYPYFVPPNYYGPPPMNLSTLSYRPALSWGALALPSNAVIQVKVPAGAKVWFDDEPTRQTGTDRVFDSPPLQRGRRYHYTVRARWMDDGKPVTQTRKIYFRASEQVTVDFLKPQG
jgi:uncharacterized protein (TIGR03000 family)